MAIRITGMYSGLDTESIINELASAQSYKKTKLVKAQTKHSWKQDAWKALNTKIYSFYQKLDDLRLQGSYKKKKTVVSNPSAVKVVSGENTVDGVHSLTVEKLARQASLTSASLVNDKGWHFTGGATLKQLGFSGKGSISVNGALGQEVKIDVSEDMTINQFVNKVKNVGLNANFDEGNQRIYISSKDTGASANFFFSANDENGFKALGALGLLTANDPDSLEYQDYKKWQSYLTDGDAKQKVIDDLVAERALEYKAKNDSLEIHNKDLDEGNRVNKLLLAKQDGYEKYVKEPLENNGGDYAKLKTDLYNKINGTEQNKQAVDEEGNPKFEDGSPVYEQAKDKDGNLLFEEDGTTPVYVKERAGGLTQDLQKASKELAELEKAETRDEEAIKAKKAEIDGIKKEIKKAEDCYDYVNAIATNEATKQKNLDKIAENQTYYTVDDSNPKKVKIEGTQKLINDVTAEVDTKIAAADDFLKNAGNYMKEGKEAHKIQGQDAEFKLDGVNYTSYNNTLSVNGMTITAMEEDPTKTITLSTTTDTDGVYDMIKGLFTAYNELINEMDSLYNAEASTGYEPLTSEEKDALTDTEIEEWEKKIKDSLMRRDSTLSLVSSAMKSVMLKGVNVNGKNMYLADFGIETLGYFKAKDNERNAYHILGDKDDPLSWEQEEGKPTLRSMIATDPDAVMDFFVGLSNNMHDELAKKMSATTLSSALTVYNDKQMKTEYDDYTKKIKAQEEKLNAYIDSWYEKFSKMETALSKLESKNNSLASLFGG